MKSKKKKVHWCTKTWVVKSGKKLVISMLTRSIKARFFSLRLNHNHPQQEKYLYQPT
jgi:hypothetical protein